jgi:ribosomal protein S14
MATKKAFLVQCGEVFSLVATTSRMAAARIAAARHWDEKHRNREERECRCCGRVASVIPVFGGAALRLSGGEFRELVLNEDWSQSFVPEL